MAATDTRETVEVKIPEEAPPKSRRRNTRWWLLGLALALAGAAAAWYLVADGGNTVVNSESTAELQFSHHAFPVAGDVDWGGEDARFGARRQGHRHQGQDQLDYRQGSPYDHWKVGTC